MFASIPSVSYLVYRGSLQTTCDNWNRITIKQMILSQSNVILWNERKKDSKEMDSFGCDMIWYAAGS